MSEDIVTEIEDLFKPRPGGMIDRHRQEVARREAAAKEQEQAEERIEERAVNTVKVSPVSPEVLSSTTYTIGPQGYAMILPQGPYRYRATILAATANGATVLAKDSGAAISGNGFLLPNGIPLVTFTRAQMYAFNPSTTLTIQVCVLAEIYAPEPGK